MKKLIVPILFLLLLAVPVFAQNTVDVYLFYGSGCPHCAKVSEYLSDLQETYPTVEVHELNAADETELFKNMLQAYDVPMEEWGYVPRVFINTETCLGDVPCIEMIEDKIEYCLDNECALLFEPEQKQELHLEKLILLAGADAISPCELAVLTLLLTAIMVRNPERKIKVLFAGLAFALAIFIAYFTFGSLIIVGFKSASAIASFSSTILYKILAIFAIGLGILNLKDFIWEDKPICEVPLSWRPKMKKLIARTTSVPGAFVVGILVSVFLTPCTIGPYFVAGGILSELSWTAALPLLFAYNIIFIIPMVSLVFIIYFGVSTLEKTTKWRKKGWKYTHLLIAALMFALGGAMLMGWI